MRKIVFSLLIISVCVVYTFAANIGNDVYAVYSETYEGVEYDVLNPTTPANPDGGFMGAWQSDTGSTTLEADFTAAGSTEVLEGLKVTVPTGNKGGGVWMQFGYSTDTPRVDETDQIATDMSYYSGGTIEFWVKASTHIQIGIRDGVGDHNKNISSFCALDGQWHYVSTTIASFGVNMTQIRQPAKFHSLWNAGGWTEDVFFWIDNVIWKSSNTQTLDITLKNISDNNTTSQITWSNVENVLTSTNPWKAADQYVEMMLDYYKPGWGIQIYTDNLHASATPQYTGSGDPAGLIDASSTTIRMPMCWRMVDVTTDTYNMVEGTDNKIYGTAFGGQDSIYPCFLWMKDRGTTGADIFVDGEDAVTVWDNRGIQHAEGTWGGAVSRNYIYLGAKFENAVTPRTYKTSMLIIELFYE
ncbi:hypothetical protein ACFL58_00600 [Elusimicrobiota bacterium]